MLDTTNKTLTMGLYLNYSGFHFQEQSKFQEKMSCSFFKSRKTSTIQRVNWDEQVCRNGERVHNWLGGAPILPQVALAGQGFSLSGPNRAEQGQTGANRAKQGRTGPDEA